MPHGVAFAFCAAMERLTAAELQRYSDVFETKEQKADPDSEERGFIAVEDLGGLARAMGHHQTQAQLAALVTAEGLDVSIDYGEFLDVMLKMPSASSLDQQKREFRYALKVLARGGDEIDVADMAHVLKTLNATQGEQLSDAEVAALRAAMKGETIGCDDLVALVFAAA